MATDWEIRYECYLKEQKKNEFSHVPISSSTPIYVVIPVSLLV